MRPVLTSFLGTLLVVSETSSAITVEPDQATRRALDRNISAEFVDEPLNDALQSLAQSADIAIRINVDALTDAGIPVDDPVNFIVKSMTLKSALRWMLRPYGLTAVSAKEGGLEVTTHEEARTRHYDLRPISGLDGVEEDQIVHTITNCLGGKWVNVSGLGGRAMVDGETLIVEQTDLVHEEVADLLTQMLRITNPRERPQMTTREKNDRAIRELLNQPVSIKWNDTPLDVVCGEVQELIEVPVVIDAAAVVRAAPDATISPITAAVKDEPLENVLDTVFGTRGLGWVIEDEALRITSSHQADKIVTRVYDTRNRIRTPGDAQNVINAIQQNDDWNWVDTTGVGGSITLLNGLLIIRQNISIHEQIAALLEIQ